MPNRAHDELHRALDLRVEDLGRVECARSKHRPKDRRDLVAVLDQRLRHGLDQVRIGGRGDEELRQPARDPPGRRRGRQDDPHDVGPVERAGLSEEGLHPVVVEPGIVAKRTAAVERAAIRERPTRPGPRGLPDVAFGVVPDPQGEELYQFAGPVLVGVPLAVGIVVQVAEHRRIPRHAVEQAGEVPGGVLAEELVLVGKGDGVVDVAERRGEVPVPEQRELLLERRWRPGHPIEPPARERDHGAGVGPVDFLVGGAELRAVLRPGPGPAQLPDHVLHPRFGGADLGVLHHGFGNRREGEDGVDGPIGTGLDRLRDLGGEGPEPRAPQQVRGLRHIPAVLGRRRKRLEASWHDGPPLSSDLTTPGSHSKRVAHPAKRAAVRKSSRETTRPGSPPGLGSLTFCRSERVRQVP